jgi:hypothetical protein
MNAMNISFLIASSPTFAPFARARFGVPRPAEGYRPDFLSSAVGLPCNTSGLIDVLFMQQISGKRTTGFLFRCVIVSVPACHWSKRTPLGSSCGQTLGGLHHAEGSNCTGCILGDAERCRRCRPASQGAAASGACSGWQVAGRQVSAWQISTSSARRDQGLTVSGPLNARKIERSGVGIPFPLMPRFGGALSLGIVEAMGHQLSPRPRTLRTPPGLRT